MASPLVEFIANILFLLEIIGLMWMFVGGDKMFRMAGYKGRLPQLYFIVQDNYIPILIALFLLSPQIIKTLQQRQEDAVEMM